MLLLPGSVSPVEHTCDCKHLMLRLVTKNICDKGLGVCRQGRRERPTLERSQSRQRNA